MTFQQGERCWGACGGVVTHNAIGHCRACHTSFNGLTLFDLHRVGKYGTPERRCLTAAEMTEKGWSADSRGVWRAAPPEVARW